MINRLFCCAILLGYVLFASGQSCGTVQLKEGSRVDNILFSPVNSFNSYLVDECGFIINQWEANARPGLVAYLDQQGNLYRSARINSPYFRAGGLGGAIEKYNWNGELIWRYELATEKMQMHHDFHLRDNGNILVLVWERLTADELSEFGRSISGAIDFYSEIILEINPEDNFNIVWEWRALDHIIQDNNPSLGNYGTAVQFPRRIDLNLNTHSAGSYLDWLHFNSIDYNEDLEIITISCHSLDECYMIDRSTTTDEAGGDNGGNYGYGGDLLFRWGNADNYNPDAGLSKKLFKQHDISMYVQSDESISISCFNNLRNVGLGNYSSADLINFGLEIEDLIQGINDLAIQDAEPDWSYNRNDEYELYSSRMSSMQLIDDHFLVCSADNGRFIEIDQDKNIQWEYINPVGATAIFSADQIPFSNGVFHAVNYEESFFDQQLDLNSSGEKLELNANPECIPVTTSQYELDESIADIQFYNNILTVQSINRLAISIYNMNAQLIYSNHEIENDFCYKFQGVANGIYLIQFTDLYSGKSTALQVFIAR